MDHYVYVEQNTVITYNNYTKGFKFNSFCDL